VGADDGGSLVQGVGTDRGVGVGCDDGDGIAGALPEDVVECVEVGVPFGVWSGADGGIGRDEADEEVVFLQEYCHDPGSGVEYPVSGEAPCGLGSSAECDADALGAPSADW